jgi:hypothetical protein
MLQEHLKAFAYIQFGAKLSVSEEQPVTMLAECHDAFVSFQQLHSS